MKVVYTIVVIDESHQKRFLPELYGDISNAILRQDAELLTISNQSKFKKHAKIAKSADALTGNIVCLMFDSVLMSVHIIEMLAPSNYTTDDNEIVGK